MLAPSAPGVVINNNPPYHSGSLHSPDMGCMVDGLPTSCDLANRLIGSGVGVPQTRRGPMPSGDTISFLTTPFMAFGNGVSGYFLPGWAELGTPQAQADFLLALANAGGASSQIDRAEASFSFAPWNNDPCELFLKALTSFGANNEDEGAKNYKIPPNAVAIIDENMRATGDIQRAANAAGAKAAAAGSGGNLLVEQIAGALFSTYAADKLFEHAFRDGADAPYDYKRKYNDELYAGFGNFNFGAMGTAMGYSSDTLLRIGGYLQQQGPYAHLGAGTPPASIYDARLGKGGFAPFGDQPSDSRSTVLGIEYAKCRRRNPR